jgi:hypothetical protein
VKFGGGGIIHHGCLVLEIFLFVVITNNLLKGVHLPCPDSSHNPPLHIIQDVIRYVVMWPWKHNVTH